MRSVIAVAAVLAAAVACGGRRTVRVPPAPAGPLAAGLETTPTVPAATPAVPRFEPTPAGSPVLDFVRDVQPLLARTCTPCHVPGGKMYDRLPFDDPKTVLSAQAGVLRRLKGDDRDLVARWIASQAEAR